MIILKRFHKKVEQAEDFVDEAVKSNCTYPREFRGLRPVEEQIQILLRHFPHLDPSHVFRYWGKKKRNFKFPQWVEGPLVVPTPSAFARSFFPALKKDVHQYCSSVNVVLRQIVFHRELLNLEEAHLMQNKLRQCFQTVQALKQIASQQPGDLQILGVQLGMRHRGLSARRAVKMFQKNEVGLPVLAGTICALTHPERFVRSSELDLNMPGDVFPFGTFRFTRVPSLYVSKSYEGSLVFGKEGTFDQVNAAFGSGSFFVPSS